MVELRPLLALRRINFPVVVNATTPATNGPHKTAKTSQFHAEMVWKQQWIIGIIGNFLTREVSERQSDISLSWCNMKCLFQVALHLISKHIYIRHNYNLICTLWRSICHWDLPIFCLLFIHSWHQTETWVAFPTREMEMLLLLSFKHQIKS